MAVNTRSRWVGLALVAVVFVTGAVAGIAADRALRPAVLEGGEARNARPAQGVRGGGGTPGMRGSPGIDASRMPLLQQLNLSEEQRARIDSILERRQRVVGAMWREQEAAFRAAMDTTQREILSVLTPEQREEYNARIRELRNRWPRVPTPRGQGGPGSPRDPERDGGGREFHEGPRNGRPPSDPPPPPSPGTPPTP